MNFWMRRCSLTALFFCVFTFAMAGSDIDFAIALAKAGYPDLAEKFVKKPGGPASKITDEKKYFEMMAEIERGFAYSTNDSAKKKEHLKKAMEYIAKTNPSPLDTAGDYYAFAKQLSLDLLDSNISDDQKVKIKLEAADFFEKALNGYIEVAKKHKEDFQKGMDRVYDEGQKFIKSKDFKAWLKATYEPFVISRIRYFECNAEILSLRGKEAAGFCDKLKKLIEEAEDFSWEVEAPIPNATVSVIAGNFHVQLSDCGADQKMHIEKALEKFNSVFDIKPQSQDRLLLKDIQGKAVSGMIDLANKTKQYEHAEAGLNTYIKDVMPSNASQLTFNDYEVIFGGIVIYAHLYKKTNNGSYQSAMNRLKDKVEQGGSAFWSKKMIPVWQEANAILGVEIKDPNILWLSGRDQQEKGDFEKAIELYQKALDCKMDNKQKFELRPSLFYSYAFCNYKLGKHKEGTEVMNTFFTEFPPKDKNLEKLADDFKRGSKLFNALATSHFNNTQAKDDYDTVLRSLDYLEIFDPDVVLFKKIDLLARAKNYIDALKLLDKISDKTPDYDRALYLKGLYSYQYSKQVKKDNNDTASDLSEKLMAGSKEAFKVFLKFVDEDKSDLLQAKIDARMLLKKEAEKILGFVYLDLEEFTEAEKLLGSLLAQYESSPVDRVHSNMYYVATSLFSCYSKIYNKEKDVEKKKAILLKNEALLKKMEGFDEKVFGQYDNPKEKKSNTLQAYAKRIGLMMLGSKDVGLMKKAIDLINKGAKDDEKKELDLYIARQLFELEDYEMAADYFLKTMDKYQKDGYDHSLEKEDFTKILEKFVDDRERSFFNNNYYNVAISRTGDGSDSTRDYTRLRRNMKYLMDEKAKPEVDTPEEKALYESIVAKRDHHVWKQVTKETTLFSDLETKFIKFLTYLGIVDDLSICYLKSKQFENAIKYLEILAVHYPGIISEEKKLANVKFEHAKHLLKENTDKAKSIDLFNQAVVKYIELKDRMKKLKDTPEYRDVNERRLLCYLYLYQLENKEEYIKDKVLVALSILYSNQEVYGQYTNLFSVLEGMGKMPEDLKPKTPEEIRLENERIKELAENLRKEEIKKREEREAMELQKRRSGGVGISWEFLDQELRDIDDETYALYKSYMLQIKGVTIESEVKDHAELRNKLNILLMNPKLHTLISAEVLKKDNAEVKKIISQLDEYVKERGEKAASESTKTTNLNRMLLEICFPKLPKVFE